MKEGYPEDLSRERLKWIIETFEEFDIEDEQENDAY